MIDRRNIRHCPTVPVPKCGTAGHDGKSAGHLPRHARDTTSNCEVWQRLKRAQSGTRRGTSAPRVVSQARRQRIAAAGQGE